MSQENGLVRAARSYRSGSPTRGRRRESRRAWGAFALPLFLAAGPLLAPACTTVPVTGRKAFNLVSLDTDKELGLQAYQEVLTGLPVIESGPKYAMVKRVFDRLVAVADDPGEFDWEVRLIDDPKVVNAWAMPGGKMAVYTGILPVTETETGLAVVMGHEIGHAVARHGTERMSQQMGVTALLEIASGGGAAQWSEVLSVLIFLPWGRKQELESDYIGLFYMARAGYDPREAKSFWTRMSQLSGGDSPPELLSTHPSDESRIAQIDELLPEALKEWRAARRAAAPAP